MAETIEDKVAPPHGAEKKEEPKIPSRWESGWQEIKKGTYDAANYGIGAAANAVSALNYGLDKLVLNSSFPIGAYLHAKARADGKGEFNSRITRDESVAGLAFTALTVPGVAATMEVPKTFGLEGMVTDAFGGLPLDALAVAGTTFFVLNPLLNLAYYPIQHLIHKKTFKGMWTDLKKEYLPSLKRTLPLNAATSGVMGIVYAGLISGAWLFPYFALSALAYRIFMSPEKISYRKLGKALISPFYEPFKWVQGYGSLAYKGATGIGQAGYAIGSSIIGWMEKMFAPKAAAGPAQATAPARG